MKILSGSREYTFQREGEYFKIAFANDVNFSCRKCWWIVGSRISYLTMKYSIHMSEKMTFHGDLLLFTPIQIRVQKKEA